MLQNRGVTDLAVEAVRAGADRVAEAHVDGCVARTVAVTDCLHRRGAERQVVGSVGLDRLLLRHPVDLLTTLGRCSAVDDAGVDDAGRSVHADGAGVCLLEVEVDHAVGVG